MLGLVPVGSAPIGILSLSIRNVANRDVDTDGWNPSVGTVIADTLDEDIADNNDYAYSSNLDDRQAPLVMALNNPLEAGTYTFNFTAQKDLEWGQVKLTLLDSNLTSVGASSWTGLVDRTFNTYSVTATTTATSAYIKVEARSDAALVLDFTDPDNPPLGVYSYSYADRGYYQDKYGFLRQGAINYVNNDTNIVSWASSTNLATYILNQDYSPDNTLSAPKLVETTASGTHSLISTSIPNLVLGQTYTRSIYLKSSGRTVCKLEDSETTAHSAVFSLSGGGTISNSTNLLKSSISAVGNGWYRCSITYTKGSSTNTVLTITLQTTTSTSNYVGDGVSGVLFWGNQLEQGFNLTAYTNSIYTEGSHPSKGPYRLRIGHSVKDFKYVSNELLPSPAPAAIPSSFSLTISTVNVSGNELVITNASASYSYFGIGYTLNNVTPGRPYYLYQEGRAITAGTGFLRVDSPSTNTTSLNRLTTTNTSAYAGTYLNYSSFITFFLYNDGNPATSNAYSTFSVREIEYEPLGLLCESGTFNELLYTENLTNTTSSGAWTYNNLVASTEERSLLNGYLGSNSVVFYADTSTSGHSISQLVGFTSGSTYIFSVFAKSNIQLRVSDSVGGFFCNFLVGGASTSLDVNQFVDTPSAGTYAAAEFMGNGWTRCWIRFTATATGNYPVFINRVTGYGAGKDQVFTNPNASMLIAHPQLETINLGDRFVPSSYIHNDGGKSYRPNDGYRVDLSGIYDATPFTLYVEAGKFSNGALFNTIISINSDSETISNHLGFEINSTGNIRITGPELFQILDSSNSIDRTVINPIAIRFEPGNYAISVGGVLTTNTNSTALPGIAANKLNLLRRVFGDASNGYIRKFKFYNRALSDGELLNLTAVDPDQNAGVNLLTTSW